MYWQIGKMIFEEEQQEKNRVDYNKYFIKFISEIFLITNALRSQISWTHYRTLLRIEKQDKRESYVAEASRNNWTANQFERLMNSLVI
jgi:hypothetical protein